MLLTPVRRIRLLHLSGPRSSSRIWMRKRHGVPGSHRHWGWRPGGEMGEGVWGLLGGGGCRWGGATSLLFDFSPLPWGSDGDLLPAGSQKGLALQRTGWKLSPSPYKQGCFIICRGRAIFQPNASQRSPGRDRELPSASLPTALCPISCLTPQRPAAAPALTHSVHTGPGKSPLRLLPKIPAGFQLPLPMAAAPQHGPLWGTAEHHKLKLPAQGSFAPGCVWCQRVVLFCLPQHLGCA